MLEKDRLSRNYFSRNWHHWRSFPLPLLVFDWAFAIQTREVIDAFQVMPSQFTFLQLRNVILKVAPPQQSETDWQWSWFHHFMRFSQLGCRHDCLKLVLSLGFQVIPSTSAKYSGIPMINWQLYLASAQRWVLATLHANPTFPQCFPRQQASRNKIYMEKQ